MDHSDSPWAVSVMWSASNNLHLRFSSSDMAQEATQLLASNSALLFADGHSISILWSNVLSFLQETLSLDRMEVQEILKARLGVLLHWTVETMDEKEIQGSSGGGSGGNLRWTWKQVRDKLTPKWSSTTPQSIVDLCLPLFVKSQ